MATEYDVDPIAIDVSRLIQRSVASLYSSLVTRPTGRAVRNAIESQILGTHRTALSLIDLSEVSVLDFSCADEVVAKLLLRFQGEDRPRDAFFVFRGIHDVHRHAIETALGRQSLAAVAQDFGGGFELMGTRTAPEARVWNVVETRGRIGAHEVLEVLPRPGDRSTLARLVERRLVFRFPGAGHYHALSVLVRDLA